jgi:WD40 repeat protein
MHFNEFSKIAHRFHGDSKLSQGVPYCIAALEDFIAIGSSDGSVRLFDSQSEQEYKVLTTNHLKGNAVTCLDIKRVKGSNLLHIVAGH